MSRVGIILAGGTGSRLAPTTSVINKHLLPVYDKPMIFYPIATLMLSGIRDIVIIHNDADGDLFKKLLGTGKSLGVRFTYRVQVKPIGIPDALNICADIIGDREIALILGDNIFHLLCRWDLGINGRYIDNFPSLLWVHQRDHRLT